MSMREMGVDPNEAAAAAAAAGGKPEPMETDGDVSDQCH